MAGVGGGVPPHAVVRSKQLRRMPDVYPGRLSMCDIMGEASNLRRIPTPSEVPSRGGDAAVAREIATRGTVISFWGGGDAAELERVQGMNLAGGVAGARVEFPRAPAAQPAGAYYG